jgi:hypothetical protein
MVKIHFFFITLPEIWGKFSDIAASHFLIQLQDLYFCKKYFYE